MIGAAHQPSEVDTLSLLFQRHFTLPPLSLVCAPRPIAAHSGLAPIMWLIFYTPPLLLTTDHSSGGVVLATRCPQTSQYPHGWLACSWPPDALVATRDPPHNSASSQSVIVIAVRRPLNQSEDFRPFGGDLDVRHFTGHSAHSLLLGTLRCQSLS